MFGRLFTWVDITRIGIPEEEKEAEKNDNEMIAMGMDEDEDEGEGGVNEQRQRQGQRKKKELMYVFDIIAEIQRIENDERILLEAATFAQKEESLRQNDQNNALEEEGEGTGVDVQMVSIPSLLSSGSRDTGGDNDSNNDTENEKLNSKVDDKVQEKGRDQEEGEEEEEEEEEQIRPYAENDATLRYVYTYKGQLGSDGRISDDTGNAHVRYLDGSEYTGQLLRNYRHGTGT